MTLLEIINENSRENFSSIEDAREQYSARELLDSWLNYEGIIGYTDKLLGVMDDLGFFPAVHEDPHQPVNKRAKGSSDKQAIPYKPEDIIAERRRRDATGTKATTTPGASMYEKADEYLESILMALDKSDDQASYETLKIVVYLAKLNQLFHQIETSPNHGKAEAIGRLLDTDFLDIHIYVTGENTLELKMFDAIHRRDVLKMTFTDLSFLANKQGFDQLTREQSYYTRTGQSFL